MASTSGAAAKRSRASAEQLNAMIDLLTENEGLASGKFQSLHGKLEYQKKWAEMAQKLNAMGGAVKSVEQWHTVWRDLKSRISVRVRDRKRQQALTGNRPIDQPPLTDMERRVIPLIGSNYIEGHEAVPDNVPLEEELQLAMEDGEEILFHAVTSASEFGADSEVQARTAKSSAQTPRRGLKRKRTEEESDAQKKFLEIAEKQADVLKMVAENSTRQTDVLKVMAENNARQTEATLAMAQAMTVVGEGMKACAEAFHRLSATLGNQ
ncbi:PREDICTED: uncharacterized protein LOC108355228 [Rhagoletis zephyria]|uniref:uncharacterized protein LOC108355228 n=1 Tax=Rhagoletis zephyria TaxID=28612 RepID=UPI000811A479|nr:PREDICTED: uncharacterized protein LOC108355228 [Rhagoletis zephyria]